jgi:D-proline reductase (dithiol) PrdB
LIGAKKKEDTRMARLDDIPEPTRTAVANLACPTFETMPFVSGPPLSRRRVAIVSSAALIRRGDRPFPFGSGEYRAVRGECPNDEMLISHVSINFDRAGFQRDINVVYPIDRLREFAADGVIGSVADTHYTIMGSTDPTAMGASADGIAAALHADRCDAVVLAPV